MIKKIIPTLIFALLLQTTVAIAGSSEEQLSKKNSQNSGNECFENVSRVVFKFNSTLDGAVFEPIAKGYRTFPSEFRKGTGNVVNNFRSLLTFSNNVLQGDFQQAGNTAGRFLINTTVGILGIWDPAETAFGLKAKGKEDFGQTLGVWGADSGCYFVLPIFGPTTTRDAFGLVGNMFLDPVYQVTHNTEVADRSYSEHNYWYYRTTSGIDFRAKNIESFDSLEENSIDFYASIKSLYLQDRNKKISNSKASTDTQNDDDWEEIDNN